MFCTDGWHYVTEAYWAFYFAADDEPDSTAEDKPVVAADDGTDLAADDGTDLAADDETDFVADDESDLSEDQGSARTETRKQRRERKRAKEATKTFRIMRALRHLRQVGILLPSGAIAKADTTLFSGAPRLEGSMTRAVDLAVGTVGTGTFRDMYEDEDPAFQRLELEREYGIFLGCPVMVKAEEIDEAIKLFFPWQTTGFDLSLQQASAQAEALSKSVPTRRKAGRPKHLDGVVEKMVRKEFTERLGPEGDLHMEKSKKVIDGIAIAWVLERTSDFLEVSDRTMREYLGDLYALRGCGK